MPTKRCTVTNGRHVDPCAGLSRQAAFGIRGGVERIAYRDFKSGEATRTFYALGGVTKRDIKPTALTCCPFCGERIDAPLTAI